MVGYFGYVFTLREQPYDLGFAWGERLLGVSANTSALKCNSFSDLGLKVRPPCRYYFNCFKKVPGIVSFRHITPGAGFNCSKGLYRVRIHAENNYARIGIFLQNAANELEPGHVWKIDVYQDDIRSHFCKSLQCILGVFNAFDTMPPRLKYRSATRQDHGVIVDDEDFQNLEG